MSITLTMRFTSGRTFFQTISELPKHLEQHYVNLGVLGICKEIRSKVLSNHCLQGSWEEKRRKKMSPNCDCVFSWDHMVRSTRLHVAWMQNSVLVNWGEQINSQFITCFQEHTCPFQFLVIHRRLSFQWSLHDVAHRVVIAQVSKEPELGTGGDS